MPVYSFITQTNCDNVTRKLHRLPDSAAVQRHACELISKLPVAHAHGMTDAQVLDVRVTDEALCCSRTVRC